jgi:hypothetical protein
VVDYLETVKGFDPSGLSAEGMSEYHPRVPNDSPENRAINRRVEIKIYTQLREGQVVDIVPVPVSVVDEVEIVEEIEPEFEE